MKHLLLAFGLLGCLTFASSCSSDSIDEMNTSNDVILPGNPNPTLPPPPPPTTDPHGDRDKDKSHG